MRGRIHVQTFTIEETEFRSVMVPKLLKVQKEGRTIYDIEVCEIHRTKMEHKDVRILYGLILARPTDTSPETERKLFPHQREYSLGGCVVASDSPKTARVYVCDKCKIAYEAWKRAGGPGDR